MVIIQVLTVGRLKNGPEHALFEKYAKRLQSKIQLTEVSEKKGSPAEVKRKETEALLALIPSQAYVVLLDEGGQHMSSVELSSQWKSWQEIGRPLYFVIGGTEGVTQELVQRADMTMSFGKMTWPHFLVRGLLAEQLYRAQMICLNHPYHRSGRPTD